MLENVKVGDWLKVQVTKIYENGEYPIRCGNNLSFAKNGKYASEATEPTAFPLNEFQGRWMMVSDNLEKWYIRKVFTQRNGKFIAWINAENDEEVNKAKAATVWEYAKEIEQPIELTLEEIAEKFGISVEQLKIKK